MDSSLLDHAPKLILGLVSSGLLGFLILVGKKSWNQSVRLYQDDLVRCKSARMGDLETIARQKETIAFLEERSDYRAELTKELTAELADSRAYTNQLLAMIQQQTIPPLPSSKKSAPPAPKKTESSP